MTINSFNNQATGGITDFAIAVSVASQLPGRFDGGPANVLRHLVLSAELTRAFGAQNAELLLNQHEWFESGADTYVDVTANHVGVAIGELVAQNGGGPQDVLNLVLLSQSESMRHRRGVCDSAHDRVRDGRQDLERITTWTRI